MIKLLRLLIVACALIVSKTTHADWINLTGAEIAPNIAEIHIHDDHVEVRLEVFVDDIAVFEDLVPDEWLASLGVERAPLDQRQARFSREGLSISDQDGELLKAHFRVVEPRNRIERRSPFAGKINPYNMRRLPEAPQDKRVLYAEIIYPSAEKPQRLVIRPPLDEAGSNRVNIGFIAYHKRVPVTDFRYLGRAEGLDLDWQDPWYSRFDNKNLTRHHRYPIMLFLYAEPRRVRLESIMRIDDLEEMLAFERHAAGDSEQMRDLLKTRVLAYHETRDLIDIDGRQPSPDEVHIEYLSAGLAGIKVLENEVDLDDASLLVGVILEYFTPALPQKVDFEWTYYNPRFDQIPVIVTDPVGPLSNFIDPDSSVISWRNYLKQYREPVAQPVRVQTGWNLELPYFGQVRVLRQLPDDRQSRAIIDGVLENLRAAFIEVRPPRRESRLGEVTSTRDIDQLNSELAKLYAPRVSGRINGEVHEFRQLRIEGIRELEGAQGFSATVSGTADIRARHWGHLDQRLISFQMLLDVVEPDDRQWRLADATVIDMKQQSQP